MFLSSIAHVSVDHGAGALATTHPPGLIPKHPIVLCHGLLGFDSMFGIVRYWNEIPEALRAAGAEVYVATVPATSATETRAEELLKQISSKYPGRTVHLVGHSMGGLDARYLVTHLLHRATFKVMSVSTFATPHRGSPAADVVQGSGLPQLLTFRAIVNLLPNGDGDCKAFASLSTSNALIFNASTPDVPGIRYLSYGCQFLPGVVDTAAWGPSFHLINLKEGPNDGVVSVASAKWGEYLGTINGVNHTEVIGTKFNTRPTDVLSFISGELFDHKALFLKHAMYLATNVENTEVQA